MSSSSGFIIFEPGKLWIDYLNKNKKNVIWLTATRRFWTVFLRYLQHLTDQKKASKYLFITELSITKNPVWVHLGVVLHALVVTPGEVEEVVVSLHRFLSSFPKTCRRERRRRRVLTKISSFWAEGGEEGGSNFGPKHYLASRADGSALDGLGQVFWSKFAPSSVHCCCCWHRLQIGRLFWCCSRILFFFLSCGAHSLPLPLPSRKGSPT